MKTTVSYYDFRKAFESIRPDNFSYDGLKLLFDYFEQYEDDTGEEIELDVIGICCEWSEDTPEAIAEAYSIELDADKDVMEQVHEYLSDNTSVAGYSIESNFIVYQQF